MYFDPNRKGTILLIDSSLKGAGGCLLQFCSQTNRYRVVEIFSKAYPKRQILATSAFHCELLSLFLNLQHFHTQLTVVPFFEIYTDNLAVTKIASLAKVNSFQARVQLLLSQFSHKMVFRHKYNRIMIAPDFHSRYLLAPEIEASTQPQPDLWSFPDERGCSNDSQCYQTWYPS